MFLSKYSPASPAHRQSACLLQVPELSRTSESQAELPGPDNKWQEISQQHREWQEDTMSQRLLWPNWNPGGMRAAGGELKRLCSGSLHRTGRPGLFHLSTRLYTAFSASSPSPSHISSLNKKYIKHRCCASYRAGFWRQKDELNQIVS